MRRVVALALLLAGPAVAAPPLPDSEDATIFRGHEAWVMEQRNRAGGLCCSLADGAPVGDNEIRQRNGQWEVLFSRRHWGSAATGEWLPIPVEAILPTASPVGMPVIWIYHGVVRCAVLGPQG